MDEGVREAVDLAVAYQAATAVVTARLSRVMAHIWSHVRPDLPGRSWVALLPEAVGAFTAAQSAAASMADGFTVAALAAQGATRTAGGLALDAEAFAGVGASGLPLETLLGIPGARADTAIAAGMAPVDALRAGLGALNMYGATEVNDAATLATQVSMVAHQSHRYIRVVGARCCSRCALLAGRTYKVAAFDRHPNDRCRLLPLADTDPGDIESPMDLYRQGRITDLTQAEREALDHGADISQVVNAKQGIYTAGGVQQTTQGTTRRGVAGARMLQARIDQAAGRPLRDRYLNYTVSRAEAARAAAKYGDLMHRGLPYQTKARGQGRDVVRQQFMVSGRPTVAQIMRDHTTFEDRTNQLINWGYIVRPQDAERSTAALNRLFRAS